MTEETRKCYRCRKHRPIESFSAGSRTGSLVCARCRYHHGDPAKRRATPRHLAVLRAARALIAEPDRWSQGASARAFDERTGRLIETKPKNKDAVQWCGLGALVKAGAGKTPRWAARAMGLKNSVELEAYNDSHDHADVLALFDRAIAKLEVSP